MLDDITFLRAPFVSQFVIFCLVLQILFLVQNRRSSAVVPVTGSDCMHLVRSLRELVLPEPVHNFVIHTDVISLN